MDSQLLCFISEVLNQSLSNIPKSHLVPLRGVSYWQIEPWLRKKRVYKWAWGEQQKADVHRSLTGPVRAGSSEQLIMSLEMSLKTWLNLFPHLQFSKQTLKRCIRSKRNWNWGNYVNITVPGSPKLSIQAPGTWICYIPQALMMWKETEQQRCCRTN